MNLWRVGELLEGALELPAAERHDWLAAACGEDRELLAEVEALLSRCEAAAGLFADLAADVARRGPAVLAAAAHSSQQLGPYRTVAELGRGGMGVVYLAERVDGQFDRRVALKVIHRGMESPEAARRFLAERQILARLDHPNIARLFDGGVSDDGRPYLVMEPVDGVPLGAYCDQRQLSVDERLRIFLIVCDAVELAHRNLVVHRDLKPSNILVTADGTVKLVDFGIAKLLEEEPGSAAEPTRTAHRALTPEYAAPELVLGRPVTTATDVYSLGVVLYELLTGLRPYTFEGRTPGEVERLAEAGEPPPSPSLIVLRPATGGSGGPAGPEELARDRASRPERLHRRLKGDLDRIVLMALRKEPDRRYPSALALREDLARHLAGYPVRARGESRLYRSAKLLRRNRWAAAAASAALLLVAGFAVAMTLLSLRLTQERNRAEQVSQLLVELFEVADPAAARGQTVTAREVLDRGSERLRERFTDQPVLRADLLDLMGRVYRNLGLYDRARPLLEEAVALRRGHDSRGAKVAGSLDELAELLRLQGALAEALPLLDEALARHGGAAGPGAARTLDTRGKVLFMKGELDAAQEALERALALNRARRDDAATGENLNNLAAVHFARGEPALAEAKFREALRLRRATLGTSHPLVAASLNNLATVVTQQGRHREAEELHGEALALYRRLLGEEHPRIATSLNNLALVHMAQGHDDEALALFERSLELRRRLLPAGHPEIAQTLTNLGLLTLERGHSVEAEAMLREATGIQEVALGDRHPATVASRNNLAMTLARRGASDEAELLLRSDLATLRATLGTEHPLVATNLTNLADLLAERGASEEAEALYREGLAIRRANLPAGHPHLAYSLVGLGRLLAGRGDAAAAEPLLAEAVSIRRATLPASHWRVGEAEAALGSCLLALGRPAEAATHPAAAAAPPGGQPAPSASRPLR